MISTTSRRLDSWKAISRYLGRDERTVRRWEKESGFPIHRVPGGKGSSVFAYESEIDEWLRLSAAANGTAAPAPLEAAPPHIEPAALTPRWSRGRLLVVVAAFCAVGAAVAVLAFRPAGSLEPFSIRLMAESVIAQKSDGTELWHFPFPDRTAWEAQPLVITGRRPAALVASAYRNRARSNEYLNGQLMEFDLRGRLRRSFEFDDRLRFGEGDYAAPWVITDFKVDDRGPFRRVAVAAHHYMWWPGVVTILDDQWRRLGTFVNSGWVQNVQWLNRDRLLVSGFSNEHDAGMVALLDATALGGRSPTAVGSKYECHTCASAFPLKYVTFGRSEVNQASRSQFNRAIVEISGDRVVIRTIEVPYDGRSGAAQAVYELSPSLELLSATYSDRYWEEHRKLEAEEKLRHTIDRCPELSPNHVKIFDIETGWTQFKK